MLKFKNGKFKIMQVSDCQDLHYVRKTMLHMLKKVYEAEKPDLIIFTGDNILGNHLRDAMLGSMKTAHTKEAEFKRMKKALDHICRQPEEMGIPFTMIYGNHDDMNEITKDEQAEIYKSYSCFIGLNEDKSVDCDTFHLPVYSGDGGKMLFNLWLFDSAWKDKTLDRCFTAVKKSTLDWYVKKSNELKEKNGGAAVPSILFQHVPMPETEALTKPCGKADKGALKLSDGTYVKLDEKKAKGFLREPISACGENYGEFDVLKKQGDVLAVVYGHDHTNNFVGALDGLKIIQSSAASFRCYGDDLRGVRVFELYEDCPENFETYFLTYGDIFGNGWIARLRYLWDADGQGNKKAALIGGVAAAGVLTGFLSRMLIKK